MCSSIYIYSPIFVVVDAYSWKLTSYTTYSISSRVYFDTYVSPPTSLLRLSFFPIRSYGSFSNGFVPNGHAPLIFHLSFSSYEVFGSKQIIKGS
jgi:hypothetical protein